VIAFGSVSLVLYLRLGASGVPPRKILALLAEVWIALGLAIAALISISWIPGESKAASAAGEIRDFAARWSQLSEGAKVVFVIGLVAAAGLFSWALVSIRRVLRDHPLQ
jgi:hypothetical protein